VWKAQPDFLLFCIWDVRRKSSIKGKTIKLKGARTWWFCKLSHSRLQKTLKWGNLLSGKHALERNLWTAWSLRRMKRLFTHTVDSENTVYYLCITSATYAEAKCKNEMLKKDLWIIPLSTRVNPWDRHRKSTMLFSMWFLIQTLPAWAERDRKNTTWMENVRLPLIYRWETDG
jgi:hypothetical protein